MDHSCIPRIEWQLAMAANKEQTLTKLSPALQPPAISKIIIIAYDIAIVRAINLQAISLHKQLHSEY